MTTTDYIFIDRLRNYAWVNKKVTRPTSWPRRILLALLPSFFPRLLRSSEFTPRRLTPTSWLNGLRGVAALFVYINHYTGGKLQYAYGDHQLVDWSFPLQLPFIRVMFCGLPMVHIFL